ncbi:MAG: hypothetical protein M3301_05120, partial [Chloroflexota bacterium]|nr:hypothetical protein [Chloroflexota bacterium]
RPGATGAAGSVSSPTAAAPLASRGEWSLRARAPTPLTEVAAAAFGGRVWIAGGLGASGEAARAVLVYDPRRNSWEAGPNLPEAVHHASLVAAGDDLYLLGGYVGPGFGSPTPAVRRLHPSASAWVDGPALPEPRAAGAAVWDGSRIVYGGGVGPAGVSAVVFVLEAGAWRESATLAEAREHLAATSAGRGEAWFLGGRRGGLDSNVGAVDVIRAEEAREVGRLPTPRGGVAAFWSGTGACLVGGEAPTGTFARVECIDADGKVSQLPDLREARHGLGAAVVDGVAYVALGGPRPGLTASDTIEALPLDR